MVFVKNVEMVQQLYKYNIHSFIAFALVAERLTHRTVELEAPGSNPTSDKDFYFCLFFNLY